MRLTLSNCRKGIIRIDSAPRRRTRRSFIAATLPSSTTSFSARSRALVRDSLHCPLLNPSRRPQPSFLPVPFPPKLHDQGPTFLGICVPPNHSPTLREFNSSLLLFFLDWFWWLERWRSSGAMGMSPLLASSAFYLEAFMSLYSLPWLKNDAPSIGSCMVEMFVPLL